MNRSKIKDSALSQLGLRKRVIDFKNKFYYQAWANYNEILSGQLKLIPSDKHQHDLKNNYKAMVDMFFGDYPSFDEMMASLQNLENKINSITERK